MNRLTKRDKNGVHRKEGNKKMKTKFKVGDVVIGNEKADYRYWITTTGWRGVVTSVLDYGFKACSISNPNETFTLGYEYFDLYRYEKIVITTDGKTTTAKLIGSNKKIIETATAHCSPDDKFDFLTGAKLAVERLEEKRKGNNPNDGSGYWCIGRDLVSHEGPKFKAGDWVRIIDNNHPIHHYFDNGDIVKVLSAGCNLLCERPRGGKRGLLTQYVSPEDVVLAEKPVRKKYCPECGAKLKRRANNE